MPSSSSVKVDKAISDLSAGRFPCARRAALAHAAPLSTVYARLRGRQARESIDLSSQRLSNKEEQMLVIWIQDLQRSYTSPNYDRFRELVVRLLQAKGDMQPLGKHWIQSFKARHPQLSVRHSNVTDVARLLSLTPMAISKFYDHLNSLRDQYSIPWNRVWNMDEKGAQLGQIGKQLVFYDKSQGPPVAPSSNNTKWVSIIECYPAIGSELYPFIIHQGKDVYDKYFEGSESLDSFTGWSWAFSTKGWTDNELGTKWMTQHFIPATYKQDEHQILILDGHESHISGEFQYEAFTNNCHLVYLPPHSSHMLQPLDLGPFGPLQKAYRKGVATVAPTGLTPLRRQEFNDLYLEARRIAFKGQHKRAGWKRAGIFPPNPSCVLDSEQVLNMTHSRPHITPPPLSEGIYTTPTTKEQVNEAVRQIQDASSPTTARHAQKLGHAATTALTAVALLQDSLGEIRKHKIDAEITKRGKQMKKDDDTRVWTFEQVKAKREGLALPPARQTTRQRAQMEARQRKAT